MLENRAMIDKLLGGRYRIIATLGSGGFSQTYVAEDTHRPGNPKCAVKHLQPANTNQNFLQSARRLFESEAESLEKLGHHDRIPRLLAYFEENQEFYLVQEFIQGQLLTEKLQPNQRWTENQVWEFIKEILEILVFIHSRGFIHRDIKPNNIIQRQQDNKLVLVDFGSVKQNWTQLLSLTANIEMPATVGIGTPGYMPMEQARGRPRPSSDIYALGAIAVQALTGLYPMQLEEDFETGELLWRQKAQVSDALALVITKMVRYHFKDRYETATDALAEVEQLAPFYLPTQINLDPNSPPVSKNGQQNQPPQNPNATLVTVPILPVSTQASSNFEELVTNKLAAHTTIFSPLKPPFTSNRHPFYLTIGATIGAGLVALAAGYALYWQPRLQIEQTLEQVENLKATGKSSECMLRAATIPPNSSLYSNAQNVLYECKLIEAKRLAAKADFKAAITLVSSLPKGTNAYSQAQSLIAQWSDSILALATGKYQAGKPKEAISLAQAIPSTSLVYQKAQASIKQWLAPKVSSNSAPAKVTLTATKTNYPAAKKVVRRSPPVYKQTTASTKKVVRRSPPVYKQTTASKPKTYSRSAAPSRRVSTSSRMAKSPSSKKYLRISKKGSTTSQVKSRTRTVVKRAVAKTKKSYNRKKSSYRWTTKTVR